MPFTFTRPAEISDLVVIKPRVFPDSRGHFLETYKRSAFEAEGIAGVFVQDNQAQSAAGVLRGLHYQLPPKAQGKLVTCVVGRVWDVAVDIRNGSPTFRRWYGLELSAESSLSFWVPAGFAHGYVALEGSSVVSYKCTEEYSPEYERAIRWDDPTIAIDWPHSAPILSEKDAAAPLLAETENFPEGTA